MHAVIMHGFESIGAGATAAIEVPLWEWQNIGTIA